MTRPQEHDQIGFAVAVAEDDPDVPRRVGGRHIEVAVAVEIAGVHELSGERPLRGQGALGRFERPVPRAEKHVQRHGAIGGHARHHIELLVGVHVDQRDRVRVSIHRDPPRAPRTCHCREVLQFTRSHVLQERLLGLLLGVRQLLSLALRVHLLWRTPPELRRLDGQAHRRHPATTTERDTRRVGRDPHREQPPPGMRRWHVAPAA